MAIPTFDKMLHPILVLASKGPITRVLATQEMIKHFGLSEEERTARIPSGNSTYVRNRTGWAMTDLTKCRLIEKVAPKTYQTTGYGLKFLKAHLSGFTLKDIIALPEWQAWQESIKQNAKGETGSGEQTETTTTPMEALDAAISTLKNDLRTRLLDAILKQTPEFFERLVLDVLLKMGYGGSREDAAKHLGQSGDEGIDGRINQDALGLDQIMVQAKRYAPDQKIDRKTIQAFIGSLAGQGVTKGVFITTSSFADSAREFVLRGSNTKVVLIDGPALLDLMLDYEIGVRAQRVSVFELDQNYFGEED